MGEFCQITISATSKKEADIISDSLVKKKIISGSLIIDGPSRYWWNNKIVEKIYYNVQAFSMVRHKNKIIEEVKKIHSDRCPIISFSEIDGNKEFLDWIEQSVK